MSIVLFKPRVGITVVLCLMLFALGTKSAGAEGGIIGAGEFVEGLNIVVWDNSGGFSDPSSFVSEVEQLSGLVVTGVFWLNVSLQVWETYIPRAPAFANTLRELPPSAILVFHLQCIVLSRDIELSVEDGVPCQERQSVVKGMSAAIGYMSSFGREVGEFSVILGRLDFISHAYVECVDNVSLREARLRLEDWTALTACNTVFVNRDDRAWQQANSLIRAEAVAHEVFHIVQAKSGCACRIGAEWLVEGSAEFLAWKALDYAGLVNFAEAKKSILQKSGGVSESLQLLVLPSELGRVENSYAVAFAAVDSLSGDSPFSQVNFWDAVGSGTYWEQAFFDEFGITIERFYEEFEAYRLNNPDNPRNPIHPFRIKLLSGPLPYWFPEEPDVVTYLFQVYGVDLKTAEGGLATFPVTISPYDAGWRGWGVISDRNLIFVGIFNTAPSGAVYRVTFTLPDGREASATLTHLAP